MTERFYSLRKVQARNQAFVTATYAVLVGDAVVGHVDKYVQPTGNRATPKARVGTFVCWGWRVPGTSDDPTGYDRRVDAIAQLMQSAVVPRET